MHVVVYVLDRKVVRLLRQLWDVRPDGELKVHLHPGQARAWMSQKRFIFMLAGTQGG